MHITNSGPWYIKCVNIAISEEIQGMGSPIYSLCRYTISIHNMLDISAFSRPSANTLVVNSLNTSTVFSHLYEVVCNSNRSHFSTCCKLKKKNKTLSKVMVRMSFRISIQVVILNYLNFAQRFANTYYLKLVSIITHDPDYCT